MKDVALSETTDFYRLGATLQLDPRQRSSLGQYMTPAPIARFMASLFTNLTGDLRILDPGAGVGSLTSALVERLCRQALKPTSVNLTCYEIEPALLHYLHKTLEASIRQCKTAGITAKSQTYPEDFILGCYSPSAQIELFPSSAPVPLPFTHVILNPPYRKIHSTSAHRLALRQIGLETSNLYTGFLFLAARQLQDGGEMVAIVPRSFCNGPYFKPFREQFFKLMGLHHLHIFERRNAVFKEDEVLQENIILHAIKGQYPSTLKITASRDSYFHLDVATGDYVVEDMTQRVADTATVIRPHDPNQFVYIAANTLEQQIVDRISQFTTTLDQLGLTVSTGPVVDFRLKADLRMQPQAGTVPLLYPTHFQRGELLWPKFSKKPNAIQVSDQSRKWLWKNQGYYVVTRRFTAKEEKRRIVASTYAANLPGQWIGFENHLNVYHAHQSGFSRELAIGLTIYLNSSLIDRCFRLFNGHTQVNATDLRALCYPSRAVLERIGRTVGNSPLAQDDIDALIEQELRPMTDNSNPLLAQRKIDEALEIVKALGLPRGQQNERSALTLLALIDLKPSGNWQMLQKPLMGITPIMTYCKEHYGRDYAPNTRETFRRQTMHQFVEAGIALYNPDKPDRPINSPKACYQISDDVFTVIQTFGTAAWQQTLEHYLEGQETLAAKWAKHRAMQMIPAQIAEGQEINLTPGPHSELIKQIIQEFAPRFAPGAKVVYVGDTGDKTGFFQEETLAKLGVHIDQHGKMPDVVLYLAQKDWLLLIESVTSHGPVDAKRHGELANLFSGATPGLVYVTAFPDRSTMAKYLADISWETEVWCADAPTHLIHFDGERFLGPYDSP